MDEIVFSLILLALFLLVVSSYNLFVKKIKDNEGKHANYLLFIISLFLIIGGSAGLISEHVRGIEIQIQKPCTYLFIFSILMIVMGIVYIARQKRKNSSYSKFTSYFGIAYASAIVIWGIVAYIYL